MKLIRMTTVGLSLDTFCRGMLSELRDKEGYEVVALSSPDSHLKAAAEREAIPAIGVPMRRDIAPMADVVSLVGLIRALRRERPDMIHTMTPKAGLLGMLAAKIVGVPVRIHTFTGLLFPTATGFKRRLLMFTDRLTCACATHVIAEGQGVKSDLLDNHITTRPIEVLGHGNIKGIDLSHYSPTPQLKAEATAIRHKFGIPADAGVLIFIGRFVGDKGLRELFEAFRSLPPSLNCHLIMVGDTEGGKDDLQESELQAMRTHPAVHFSDGWVADVRPWLLCADALVFPSYREGFPNVVLEAGALSLPSIVTDINGSREIITEAERDTTKGTTVSGRRYRRDNGFIVPPKQAAPLAEAIIQFFALTPSERESMARASRLNIERRFTQTIVRSALYDFYRKVTSDKC